jgi:hypothetical protein
MQIPGDGRASLFVEGILALLPPAEVGNCRERALITDASEDWQAPATESPSQFQQKATSVRRGEIFRLVAGGGGRRSPMKPVGDDAL